MTLDGVMQAPGGKDEDIRGGFSFGGWAMSRNDEVGARILGQGMTSGNGMLFGRWTYELFAGYWPLQTDDNPFTPVLNAATKYVLSRTLEEPLPWENSVLLRDVEELRGIDANLTVLGSGEMTRSLLEHDLVDEYLLMIHPVVLGTGTKLFGQTATELELVEVTPTTTGVLMARYRTVRPGR
ncbi:dihydrofolate reductase family protein [Herbidospora sp. RD11066]